MAWTWPWSAFTPSTGRVRASSPSAHAWQAKLEHTTTLAYPEALRRDLWKAMELSAVDCFGWTNVGQPGPPRPWKHGSMK